MISKKVPEGTMIPPLYGISYHDYLARVAVCYPIPLNFLVAGIRQVWLILKRGISPRKWALRERKLIAQAYQSGRTAGYANGLDVGYRKGVEAGKTEAATIISQVFARARENENPTF